MYHGVRCKRGSHAFHGFQGGFAAFIVALADFIAAFSDPFLSDKLAHDKRIVVALSCSRYANPCHYAQPSMDVARNGVTQSGYPTKSDMRIPYKSRLKARPAFEQKNFKIKSIAHCLKHFPNFRETFLVE